jgi:hypothetical protein
MFLTRPNGLLGTGNNNIYECTGSLLPGAVFLFRSTSQLKHPRHGMLSLQWPWPTNGDEPTERHGHGLRALGCFLFRNG